MNPGTGIGKAVPSSYGTACLYAGMYMSPAAIYGSYTICRYQGTYLDADDAEYTLSYDDNTGRTYVGEEASYYERGFGMMGIFGAEEYNEFSKAVFGDEMTLADDPDLLFTYNEGDFQILPVAVGIWRYMQSYHSALPSAHDVITGLWTPTEAEAEAGLAGPHDFCTLVSVVAAGISMRTQSLLIRYPALTADADTPVDTANELPDDCDWDCLLVDAEVSAIESIADGSLGWAAYQMAIAFGLDTEDEDYDLTCSLIGKWPEPVEDYTNIYLDGECTTEGEGEAAVTTCEVEFVAHHTMYSAFVEGDYKRLVMDLYGVEAGTEIVTRREENSF